MSYFKHFIIIILCLIIKTSTYDILKKNGKLEDTDGSVIFESKGFYANNNMYFKITINNNKDCKSDLGYKYYDTSEGISSSSTDYYVSKKSSEDKTVKGTTSTALFFTIKKKSSEYKGSNGNYLFLNINCYGKIDFENTESDQSKSNLFAAILSVAIVVLFFAIFGGLLIYCTCKKRRELLRQPPPINQPYIMYGNPQMYQQQGNIPTVYKGKPVVIQPNGIPYNNNSNILYSNLPYNPYNPANASMSQMSQMNQPQNQQYNIIDQSSADRGYNSKDINEKDGK